MDAPDRTVLSRTSLNDTDLPAFAGVGLDHIIMVTTEPLAEAALDALMAATVIGFDTESKPTFIKGEISTGPHLVQLATDTETYLFPTSTECTVSILQSVLESPHILKVGFGLGNDRSALKSRLGVELQNVLDLGEVLRGNGKNGTLVHRGTVGAKVAAAHFFGEKLQKSKKVGTSNWALPRLSERQMLYAANDAYVALKIYQAWQRQAEGAR